MCSPFCRLNSGPVRDFSRDVGNRTTFRISYPEGSPKTWEDADPQLQFVAVIYKSVDFNWLHAMISGTTLVSSMRSCFTISTLSFKWIIINLNAFSIYFSLYIDSLGPQIQDHNMIPNKSLYLLHIFHVFIIIYLFFTTYWLFMHLLIAVISFLIMYGSDYLISQNQQKPYAHST